MLSLQEIRETIALQEGVSDFKIVEQEKNSYELFFVHKKLETARRANSLEREIFVYVNHDEHRGMGSFKIFASTDRDELLSKLSVAVKNAKLIFDEPYVLPNDETCDARIPSDLADADPKEAAAKLAEAVFSAGESEELAVNALEIFVVKQKLHVVNSRGIDKTQIKHVAHVEAIPTANGKENSVELFESYELASLDLDWLKGEMAARLADAGARLKAEKPAAKLDCPVVLNAYELRTLFEEIARDMNYAAAYARVNLHNVGDALQTAPTGDKLCITMRGSLKGSPASNAFDLDGTTLVDREIVHDGRFVAGYGSARFAGYLGKTPTGALGCIDVRSGDTPCEELLKEPHLELVYLSGIQIDLLSDYIGGEIRLAYYFDGTKKIPVSGVAFSGKLSEALNTIRLSSERTLLNNYEGPQKAALNGLNIF